MKHQHTTLFLRELVSDQYTFFWEVYDGKYGMIRKAMRGMAPLSPVQKLEDRDARPPFVVCTGSNRKRHYGPLRRNPALHRTFCEISDDGKILEFAATYGFLGYSSSRRIRKKDGSPGGLLVAESLDRWKSELTGMKRLIHLWELVQNKRYALLEALVSREDDGLHMVLDRRRDIIAGPDSPVTRQWGTGDRATEEAALCYLADCINRKVAAGVNARALPHYQKRIYLSPGSLLSAMWLMFFWEVIGEIRPHRCRMCGAWFDPRRSTRKTCSDRCRKRLSRQKTESQ
jgi:hypothetical protein